LGYRCNYW